MSLLCTPGCALGCTALMVHKHYLAEAKCCKRLCQGRVVPACLNAPVEVVLLRRTAQAGCLTQLPPAKPCCRPACWEVQRNLPACPQGGHRSAVWQRQSGSLGSSSAEDEGGEASGQEPAFEAAAQRQLNTLPGLAGGDYPSAPVHQTAGATAVVSGTQSPADGDLC